MPPAPPRSARRGGRLSVRAASLFKPSLCKGGCRAKRGGRVVKVGETRTKQPFRQARSSPATSPCTGEAKLGKADPSVRPVPRLPVSRRGGRLPVRAASCSGGFRGICGFRGGGRRGGISKNRVSLSTAEKKLSTIPRQKQAKSAKKAVLSKISLICRRENLRKGLTRRGKFDRILSRSYHKDMVRRNIL